MAKANPNIFASTIALAKSEKYRTDKTIERLVREIEINQIRLPSAGDPLAGYRRGLAGDEGYEPFVHSGSDGEGIFSGAILGYGCLRAITALFNVLVAELQDRGEAIEY